MVPGGTTATYQGGVMAGPLYNGQDYLGDDPDPNIRSYLLRDLSWPLRRRSLTHS